MLFSFGLFGHKDAHQCAAARAWADLQRAAAHQREALADVCKPHVRCAVRRRLVLRAVVLDQDLGAAVHGAGAQEDPLRTVRLADAVLDAVFHDGLERQRRQAEGDVVRIVLHGEL